MPISHTVWSLDEKKPLQTASLIDEKELELLLRDNIEILNKGWLVISNQVKTDAGKFIDILCIDHDGDMVVVRVQENVEDGEIAVVRVNGDDATCKVIRRDDKHIYLQSINPMYMPMTYNLDDMEKMPIEIVGKVFEIRRKLY